MALHNRDAIAVLLLLSLAGFGAIAAVGGEPLPTTATESGGNVTVLAAHGVVADDITEHGDVRDLRADGTLDAVGADEPVVTVNDRI